MCTQNQLAQILSELPEPSYTLLLLLGGTGLRVGEAIGFSAGRMLKEIVFDLRGEAARVDLPEGTA